MPRHTACWLATAALLMGSHALAQTAAAPTPPAALSSGDPGSPESPASFVLKRITFNGNADIASSELNALAAPLTGQQATLADLEALAAQITQLYQSRGYFLAQAIVPQQRIQDGQAEISVLEGRLGKVTLRLAADAPISETHIRAILDQMPVGAALKQDRFERTMLLLSDLPGLKVQAGLEQGADTGATDLVVEITAADKRWQATLDADNNGTPVSGRERLAATLRYTSPFGIGDNIDARLMSSFNGLQTLGRLSYEAPLGADGLRVGAGISRVGYELGAQFAALGATGTADVIDVSAGYPLLRSRTKTAFVRAALETKHLKDTTAAISLESDKRVNAASAGLTWEARDEVGGGGYVNAGITAYAGQLHLNNAITRLFDQDPLTGHHTEGSFGKLNLLGSRLQALFGRHNLYASFAGQWASKNLDPSEKLALGGERAVRAYPSGEVLVDIGWVGSIEWRYSAADDLVIALFHDVGQGDQSRDPNISDTQNKRTLRGTGLGVTWNAPYAITVRAAAAWRHGDAPKTDTGNDQPRWLLQVQKAF